MICAESLHEMDTDVSGTIKLDNHEKSFERRRDVIKKTAFGMEFVLLGIESRQHIHYAMPLRNMHKTSDEFLSGMGKEDRLHPIITLTVYYGEVPWDGPMNLRSMMTEIPEAMEKAFYDYGMNLLEVRKSIHEEGEYV